MNTSEAAARRGETKRDTSHQRLVDFTAVKKAIAINANSFVTRLRTIAEKTKTKLAPGIEESIQRAYY